MQIAIGPTRTTPGTAPRHPRTPMTRIVRPATEDTYYAPVTDPLGRSRRELWHARSADGLWTYRRLDDERTTPWEVTYLPTGQIELYGTLGRARQATAGWLLDEMRRNAYGAALGPLRTVAGVRQLAVHMRLAGADEVDHRCKCGGLLVASGARLVHVDACAECHRPGEAGIGDCSRRDLHRFCTNPRPLPYRPQQVVAFVPPLV